MSLFTTVRERRLWLWTLALLVAIYSTIGFVGPLAGVLRDRDMITIGFWTGLILVAVTIVVHGLKSRPGKTEIVVWLGIASVYLLVFLRMSIPEERGHLIEYGVVAVFIHEALKERATQGRRVGNPALVAILLAALLGVLDESVQAFLPNRVFDPLDIFFNTMATLMAIGASSALSWARRQIN